MKKFNSAVKVIVILAVVLVSKYVFAGPPLTNLEGVGGIAFNPLAYLADSGEDAGLKIDGTKVASKPRIGSWYVNLSDVKVDWTAIGVADTFFNRLEVSYGYETVNPENSKSIHKHNIGAKLLVLKENSFDTNYVPAVSVGAIFKQTSNVGAGSDDTGADYYGVATKLITSLPRPVLISGGLLSTKAKATGVFGYDKDSKLTGFGNIDIIFPLGLIAGFEYKQGADYSDWKDANYWNTHVAWTANNNLTIVLALVNAGDYKSTSKVGLGNGFVSSIQYAF